jgi:NADH-quinone oxidoreductase subunit L
LHAFQSNKAIWVVGIITAMMTAFYMFRLMSMTFWGEYRGPAWDAAGHGHASEPAHDVAHGPAEPHDAPAGHGHGPWHGPHESPTPMTFPLMALAIGALVAGFVGIPAALGGPNALEHFLEPSFTAERVDAVAQGRAAGEAGPAAGLNAGAASEARAASQNSAASTEPDVSRVLEIALMLFSLVIAVIGITAAYKVYVTSPEISERLAQDWAVAHRTLSNKYYVDELYNATVVAGTFGLGRDLWSFDRRVVDGAVNGTSWVTVISAWFSGLTDRTVVDGLVNLVGRICEEGSYSFRKLQTGLVQNYALLMLFGVFAFVTVYLFVG